MTPKCTLCPMASFATGPQPDHVALAEHVAREHGDRDMVVNRCEAYPATVSTPPAAINFRRVLAWAELRRQNGHYPSGYVLCSYGDGYKYVTWRAYSRDGGRTWAAEIGHYWHEHEDALRDFFERCNSGRLADK
jgi:hypothetical protein